MLLSRETVRCENICQIILCSSEKNTRWFDSQMNVTLLHTAPALSKLEGENIKVCILTYLDFWQRMQNLLSSNNQNGAVKEEDG